MRNYKRIIFFLILIIFVLAIAAAVWFYMAYKVRWEGKWVREKSDQFFGGTIEIKNETSSNFSFIIDVYDAPGGGNIEGVAQIEGNKALFISKESDDKCQVSFEFKTPILLSLTTDGCSGEAGFGVSFYDDYLKN